MDRKLGPLLDQKLAPLVSGQAEVRAELAELRHINQKVLADISEIWGSDFEDLARGDLERALTSVYAPLLRWGVPSCNIFFSDQLSGNQVLPAVQILGISRSEIMTHILCDALAIVTFPDNPVNPDFRCLTMMEASGGLDRGDVQNLVTKVQWLTQRLRETDHPLRRVLPCIMSREFTQGALEHAQEHHILPFAQQGDRKWVVPGVPGADAPAADTPAQLAWRAAGLPHPRS